MSSLADSPSPSLVGRIRSWRPNRIDVAVWLGIAAISYVPLIFTQWGWTSADTKIYLYLDPGRLIRSAISMWNPDVGAGTVTHQNIGFLFPMGPYYWLIAQLHIPVWVGQRIWMGTLFFAAGTGVWFLGRLLGLSRSGRLAAALAYMLTPYVLSYIDRISAILMPWAGAGWLLAFAILAARRGGWRYPALFAVIIALVGGVNATSILLIGLAPLLWLIYAVWGSRELTWHAAWTTALKLGVLSLGVSLWWMAGLWAEGAYGINVLLFTETVPTVALTSLSSEILRGLGYWSFYGQDKVEPWITAALDYMQRVWLIGVSFLVSTVCVVGALLSRWRYRAFAITLILVGIVLAVGTYPTSESTPFGALVKLASSGSTVALALRSTNRIVPLIVLGLALLLGAAVAAVTAWRRRVGFVVLAVSAALIGVDLAPMWTGNLIAQNLARPGPIPSYVTHAASYLDAHNNDTRVLQYPGIPFGYYRWGVTTDPVWPGLMTRPYLIRTGVPAGEPGTVNLLQAIDESMQDGVFVPQTLVPIASLMSVGDILYQSDVQYERFSVARPEAVWRALTNPKTGLEPPVTFGHGTQYQPIRFPLTDETQLAFPTGSPTPPPVAVFGVPNARPISRTESPSQPLLVAGDGEGLVAAAGAGLLASNPTVLYSATYAHDRAGLDAQMRNGAVLVLTDSNQKKDLTWGAVLHDYGFVQQANQTPLVPDPSQAPMPIFPGAGTDTQTVAQISGVASVRATAYGNTITNTPEDQPLGAVDGNPATAWSEGVFGPGTNQSIQVKLTRPVTTNHITLLQPQGTRYVTDITVTFDGGNAVHATLGPRSLTSPGQVVSFPSRTFSTIEITIDATNVGVLKNYFGQSGVGFAEIAIPGVAPATEALRLPSDLLHAAGPSSQSHQLDVLLNRIRAQVTPGRTDPEPSMARVFTLPTSRSFSVSGAARISTLDPDPQVNDLLGVAPTQPVPAGDATITQASSSSRLPGDLAAGSAAAVDGTAATAWMPGLGNQVGNWVSYDLSQPVTFDHLDLAVVADGKHSIPTRVTVSTPSGSESVALPHIDPGAGRPQGSVTPVALHFPALSGSSIKLTIDAVDPHNFLDYLSEHTNTDPVGLAEIQIPGVDTLTTPPTIPTRCYSNLVTIDGHSVDIAISGTTAEALANQGLTIRACGSSAGGITLPAGQQLVTTATQQAAGMNVDTLDLGSAAGGQALPLLANGQLPAPPHHASPATTVQAQGRTQVTVRVHGQGKGFWLILGQSQSRGWQATTSNGHALGSSTLIDGYANAWYVPGAIAKGPLTITMTWTPQRVVNVALILSAITLLLCLVLVIVPARRLTLRRRRARSLPRHAPASAGATLDEERDEAMVAGAAEPFHPLLISLVRSDGAAPRWRPTLLLGLIGGLAAGFFIQPLAGLVIAAVLVLELRVARARALVVAAIVALMLSLAGYMMWAQWRNGYLPDITWPARFGPANSLAWMAVALLGVDGLVQVVRHRVRGGDRRATTRPGAHPDVPAEARTLNSSDDPSQPGHETEAPARDAATSAEHAS